MSPSKSANDAWPVTVQVLEPVLEKFAFLIGDWRGTGYLDFPAPKARRASYNIMAMFKIAPTKDEIVFSVFSDNAKTEEMFHSDQGFISLDPRTGEARARRYWLMDNDREGFVTVERFSLSEDGNQVNFTVEKREGVSEDFKHDGIIEKIDSEKIVIRGTVHVSGRNLPYVDTYVKRKSLGR